MKRILLLLLLFVYTSIQAQIPQISSLVGEYKFNGNTDDSSGNNYDGQTYGGPTLTLDRFGNNNSAYSLDGTDDYIHFDDNMLSEWNTTNGWIVESFSISFWAKSSVSAEEPIIAFGVHNSGNLYDSNSLYKGMITRFGTTIRMNSNNWPTYSNNAGFSTSGRTHDGQWHHYVLVWNYDTGYRQAYIDGSLVGQYQQVESGNIRKRFAIRDKALSVGRERYGNDGSPDDPGLASTGTYTGSVDEVRIWNLALTSSEISNLYSYDNTSSNYSVTNYSSDSTITTDESFSDVVVDSGVTLTIEPSGSLDVSGTLTNNGTIVMQSSSSTSAALMAENITGSGSYTYKKHVASTSTNDLISAPFTGEIFSDIVSNTNLYTNPADATQYLFGPFDNNTGAYLTYDSDTDGSEAMTSGKGFRVGSYGQATDLFISEYAEGSSNNKYIEIYNGTGTEVDLSNYAFAMTNNSPVSPGQYDFWIEFTSGATIAAGDVYVIAHTSADPSILANADQTYGNLSNGDDGFGLIYGTEASYTVIDWLGDWNGDPGSGWSVAGTSSATKDKTLVRKSTVCSPNTDWSSSAGTNTSDSEWIIYPQNTWDYLGSHTSNCSNSVSISGTFETSNQSIAINVGSDATYGKWNLVGNPFPSYLDLAGFISDNSAIIEDVNNAVYAYDGDDSDGSNWTIYHSSNSSGVTIAPGQAFFVASSSGGGNLDFNTSRQTVTGGDDFLPRQAQTLDSFFKLNLESSNSLTHTDIYFNSNASQGLDIGYDVGTYANLASSFSLYSKLASGEYFETNFAIQTISNDLSETVVIPLGVHTSAGESHSISIDDVSLLESINVYLKDYETGTLTLLNNGAYSFSTDNTLEGISRFELRLTNTTLGIESDELVTNFKAVYQNGGVVLVGDFMLEDKVEIFDIMGRLTQTHTIKGNHSVEVSKDELATGVYLAKINREGNSKTIKFIIN